MNCWWKPLGRCYLDTMSRWSISRAMTPRDNTRIPASMNTPLLVWTYIWPASMVTSCSLTSYRHSCSRSPLGSPSSSPPPTTPPSWSRCFSVRSGCSGQPSQTILRPRMVRLLLYSFLYWCFNSYNLEMTYLEVWCFSNIAFSFGSLLSYVVILINLELQEMKLKDIWSTKKSAWTKTETEKVSRNILLELFCFFITAGGFTLFIFVYIFIVSHEHD